MLVYENVADQLMTIQAENHNNRAVQGSRPLLVLDVWEHAYYLQYENNSSEYIDNFWNVVDWDNVAMQYERAQEGHGA
jgi:Fe-Mn family superoxide dismutase